jgi:HAD superfamily hydrolase (TIGR01509 family)
VPEAVSVALWRMGKITLFVMGIKAILLDLGGVVFQSTGISNDKIDWSIITTLNHKYGHALNMGEDRFPDFLAEYNRMSQQNLGGEAFLTEVFNTLEFNAELVKMLGERFEIIIVSDNYRENIAYISERYQFKSWSKQQFYSFDFQLEKANPLFFKRLLKEIPHYPEELIFIDDSPAKLQSARVHGIRGLLFQNNQQLKDELSL